MAAPLIAAAGLGAFQVISGFHQADSIRRQASITKKINEMNAQFIEVDAYEAEKFGFTEAAAYQTDIDQTIGSQRAGYAGQNVDVNFGTAAEVQGETQLTGFLNIIDIKARARAKSLGLKRDAITMRLNGQMQGQQAAIQAGNAQLQGITNAAQVGISAYARK